MNFVRGYPAPHYYAGANLCDSRAQSRTHLGYAEKKQSVRSKHLGSAAYLTSKGHVTQTLNYLPYGEDWVDIKHNLDPSLGQYTFTGKEKDEETGYGYFGARYMDHELMTMWISVDPMADKYPSISPYVYCAWNPVKLVDPDGREFGDYYAQNIWGTWKKIGSDGSDDGKVYVVPFKEDQGNVKSDFYTHVGVKFTMSFSDFRTLGGTK